MSIALSPADPGRLAINAATLRRQWSLPQLIDGCARQGIRFVGAWRDQIAATGVREIAARLRDTGVSLSSYCRGGGFPARERSERKRVLADNQRAVDEALALGAPCLVIVSGGLPQEGGDGISRDLAGAREMVRDGLGELLEYARPAGMPLAIEPLHPMYAADRGCISTLAQANALCDELGPGLGVAVDAYHVWWDPALDEEIERAGGASPSRLLLYQISDWLVPTTHLVQDRGMMGDGVIDLARLRARLEQSGYRGPHEVEILSAENWARRDPLELLAICRRRHAEAC